jgi:spore maturation protein CgeB
VVVKASGVGVCDESLERAVATSRRPGQIGIFWDVDAPATLDRLRRNPDDAFHALIGQFDFVLTYGGGPPVVDAYCRLGARVTVPIYNAVDPTTHFRVDADPRFAADLTFLGNRLPDRETRVHEFFVRPAAALDGQHFLIGGSGWDAGGFPRNVRYVGHVGTADHNALNSSARVVLNINRASMAATGYSPATRVFEAAGAGACVITDDWTGIECFFEPGTEVLTATDGGAVSEWLRRLSDAECRRVGEAARRRVLADHTYEHRAAAVHALLDGRAPE